MIKIVSFDYFEPFEYIEVNFTEVWAWSPNFAWLGYESVNFLIGLGSLAIFASLQLVFLSLLLCRLPTLCKKSSHKVCNKLGKKLQWESQRVNGILFMHGTFFDIATCVFISMEMIKFFDVLNEADRTSIAFSLLFGVVLALYLSFVIFFALCRSNQMALA